MRKTHRPTNSGHLRPQSRQSSAAKLARDLQFTQKEPQALQGGKQHPRGAKSSGAHVHDAGHNHSRGPLPRSNSAVRTDQTKDSANAPYAHHHSHHVVPATRLQPTDPSARTNGKVKAGFMIASPGEDDDDDDAWVSTESGAATPSNDSDNESGDTESDRHVAAAGRRAPDTASAQTPVDRSGIPKPDLAARDVEQKKGGDSNRTKAAPEQAQALNGRPHLYLDGFRSGEINEAEPELPRVPTARPHDYPTSSARTPATATPARPQEQGQARPIFPGTDHHNNQRPQDIATRQLPPLHTQLPARHSDHEHATEPGSAPAREAQTSARSNKRLSATRPPSLFSATSRTEHGHGPPLRPHPLIRGQSYGQPHANVSKPAPLEPLTVISSPAQPIQPQSAPGSPEMSTSPISMKTGTVSPSSPQPVFVRTPATPLRRTSVSSARSVATVPGIPTASATLSQPRVSHPNDRSRTLSTLSTLNASASSAAVSSLAHLPNIAPTPHAPQAPPTVIFFPPQNPHVNLDAVHPLLPRPYLHSHMAILARRDPFRESFERIARAKQGISARP